MAPEGDPKAQCPRARRAVRGPKGRGMAIRTSVAGGVVVFLLLLLSSRRHVGLLGRRCRRRYCCCSYCCYCCRGWRQGRCCSGHNPAAVGPRWKIVFCGRLVKCVGVETASGEEGTVDRRPTDSPPGLEVSHNTHTSTTPSRAQRPHPLDPWSRRPPPSSPPSPPGALLAVAVALIGAVVAAATPAPLAVAVAAASLLPRLLDE